MDSLLIKTAEGKEVHDITHELENLLDKKGIKEGIVHLFVTHTTAAITCADLDPGTDQDMLDAYTEMIPKLKYRHPHDPGHVGEHIMSSLVGAHVTVPFKNSKLILGTWQRVVLIDFSGPRKRRVVVNILPSTK